MEYKLALISKIFLSILILYPLSLSAKSDIQIAGDYLQLLIPAPDGSDTKSFPSGHTASAFSGAFYIHSRYKNTTQGIIAYTLASFVAYSRAYAKKHYISDVVAGALISYAFDKYFVNKNMNITINQNKQSMYFSWKM